MRRTLRQSDEVRRSLSKAMRGRLLGTAEDIAKLPAQTLRALEARGLAEKKGQRWKLTNEGRRMRMLERGQRSESEDG